MTVVIILCGAKSGIYLLLNLAIGIDNVVCLHTGSVIEPIELVYLKKN